MMHFFTIGKEGSAPGRPGCVKGIAFDAGGLIALDRNVGVNALLARATELSMRVTVPATALAQAIRNPARQTRLARLSATDLVPLDGPDATAVGLLLAKHEADRSATAVGSSLRALA